MDRKEALERAKRDLEHRGDEEFVLEFVAEHSTDPEARELARRAFEIREERDV